MQSAAVRPAVDIMRYALLTAGTRGDVQPFIALAASLTMRGHSVLLVAPAKFEPLATDAMPRGALSDGRFRFATCGMDAVPQPSEWFRHSSFVDVLKATRSEMRCSFATLAAAFWAACEPYRPHCVVAMSMSLQIGALIAERMHAACWSVHFAPAVPSRHTLPAPAPPGGALAQGAYCGLGGRMNYARHLVKFARLALVAKGIYADLLHCFKEETLGLTGGESLHEALERFHLPILCAYSSTLAPRPPDWTSDVFSTGPWTLTSREEEEEEEEAPPGCEVLASFLAANRDAPPICVGFGSLSEAGASSLAYRIALRVVALGHRVVVLGAMSNFPRAGLPDAAACVAERAPHAWLLPQCAALVHHGGAGTTVAALAAGIPAVIAPLLLWSDQPAWADALVGCGAGAHLPQAGATDDAIDAALDAALAAASRAAVVGEEVQREARCGADAAAALLSTPLRELLLRRRDRGGREGVAVVDDAFVARHCVVRAATRREGAVEDAVRRRRAAAAATEGKGRANRLLARHLALVLVVVVTLAVCSV